LLQEKLAHVWPTQLFPDSTGVLAIGGVGGCGWTPIEQGFRDPQWPVRWVGDVRQVLEGIFFNNGYILKISGFYIRRCTQPIQKETEKQKRKAIVIYID
jgi:hypothetical protein